MNEPCTYGVPLEGHDTETRAINAAVYLLEVCNFSPGFDGLDGQLNPAQKERVARYLIDRYSLGKSASEVTK